MANGEDIKMLEFMGSYLVHLDAKGRVSLPKTLKHIGNLKPILTFEEATSKVHIYPREVWVRKTDPDLYSRSYVVTVDNQGRIRIPKYCLPDNYRGVQVKILGAVDHLEIEYRLS